VQTQTTAVTQEDPRVPRRQIIEFHQEMIDALGVELTATREKDEREGVKLSIGRRAGRDEFATLYEFRWVQPTWAARKGRPYQCRLGSNLYSPTVASYTKRSLVLRFADDHGNELPAGRIWEDTAWMVERLQERLQACANAFVRGEAMDPPFHFATALRLAGLEKFEVDQIGVCENPVPSKHALNVQQITSVRRSLGRPVGFIWGPPGTGKTTTLVSISEAHFKRGDSLLIAAPSNTAIDTLLDRLCERLQDDPEVVDGTIIRMGTTCTGALRPEFQDAILYGRVLARQREERREEISRLEEALSDARQVVGQRAEGPRLLQVSHGLAEARIKRIASDLRVARYELQELPWHLLKRAKVVGGTVHQTYLNQMLQRDFDAVVVDEASMVQLPAVYTLAGLARDHLTVSGDFMQLPVPVNAIEPAVVQTLGTDIFRRRGFSDVLDGGPVSRELSVLTDQYRMPHAVCEVINAPFYGGLLQTVGSRPNDDNDTAFCGVALVDTSSSRPRVHAVGGSRRNLMHAECVARIVRRLVRGGAEDGDILIVAPFRAQARLINTRLREYELDSAATAATVHRAQGSEAKYVIVDLTDAGGLPVSRFLAGDSVHGTGPRLLNVALSRTRQGLIVVADQAYLRRWGGDVVRALLTRIVQYGTVVEAAAVMRAR
jgi:AAA domain-containing protein